MRSLRSISPTRDSWARSNLRYSTAGSSASRWHTALLTTCLCKYAGPGLLMHAKPFPNIDAANINSQASSIRVLELSGYARLTPLMFGAHFEGKATPSCRRRSSAFQVAVISAIFP